VRSLDGNSGWNCQPTSTGAICTHAGIAPVARPPALSTSP
jgi:hypothetical protein